MENAGLRSAPVHFRASPKISEGTVAFGVWQISGRNYLYAANTSVAREILIGQAVS